jgi:hypothetical protein
MIHDLNCVRHSEILINRPLPPTNKSCQHSGRCPFKFCLRMAGDKTRPVDLQAD